MISTLRTLYSLSILASLLSGVVAAVAFALAFAIGGAAASSLSEVAIELLAWTIPVVAAGILAGLIVLYLDPEESHAFQLGDDDKSEPTA